MILLGPTNAIRHPFMHDLREGNDDMAVMVGPIETMGHPFRVVTEVPVERVIGNHLVYAFGTKWLYSELEIIPEEEIEAIVVWDPGWLRTGQGDGAIHEIRKLWEMSREMDVPLIGLYSDWFAAWQVSTGIVGTLASVMYCDAIIIDPAGAASLRAAVHPLRVTDPEDRRFRPIHVLDSFLTYGRLPRVGGGLDVEIPLPQERDIDVAMVSTLHPQHVVLRPYYVEKIKEICTANGWSFEFRDRASAEEMEELYLNSQVVVNVSLGSQPNCRVSEALACGCILVSDGWNIGMKDVPHMQFNDVRRLEQQLRLAVSDGAEILQKAGLEWASKNRPEHVWARVFDAVMEVAPLTRASATARLLFEKEMEQINAAN